MNFSVNKAEKRAINLKTIYGTPGGRVGLIIVFVVFVCAIALPIYFLQQPTGPFGKGDLPPEDYAILSGGAVGVMIPVSFVFVYRQCGKYVTVRRNERLEVVGNELHYSFHIDNDRYAAGRNVILIDLDSTTVQMKSTGLIAFDGGICCHFYEYYGSDPLVPKSKMENIQGFVIGNYFNPDLYEFICDRSQA